MDDASKESLIAQFRAYLEAAAAPNSAQEQGATDLFDLFSELAALRTEVKLEARQFKAAMDQFREMVSTLQAGYGSLQAELEQRRAEQQAAQCQTLRPVLLQLLDLRDRIEAGVHAAQAYRPRGRWRFCKQDLRFVGSLRDGQEITLRRLDQMLAEYRVVPIEVLGKPLDPHAMRAAATESRTDVGHGIVTGELRKGFFWEGEVLRLAEVRVNRP